MVKLHEVERQLKKIGATYTMWTWPEIRELQNLLMPREEILACVSGRYENGFAIICITNVRILLIDKKIFYLTVEDIRYDMVVEVDFSYRLLDATVKVVTPSKVLTFTSLKKQPLRNAAHTVQHKVMEVRQHSVLQQSGQIERPVQRHQPETFYDEPARADNYVPLVATNMEPERPFIPQLPFRDRGVNPYTKSPLSTRRRVSRFYQYSD